MTANTDTQPALADLYQKCAEAGQALAEIRGRQDKSGNYADELRAATNKVHAANDEYSLAEKKAMVDMFAQVQAALGGGDSNGPRHANDGAPQQRQTFGQRVVSDERFEAFAARGGRGELEVRDVSNPETVSQGNLQIVYPDDATGAGLFVPRGTPQLVGPYNMRMFVRNLLSVGQTTLGNIPFIRESGNPGATGADFVAEGGSKPQVTIGFTPDDAPVRKIAAWLAATYEILSDAPTLRSYIDARLVYMLRVTEEQALLNGTGVAPQIKGIFTYAEVQDATGADLLDVVAKSAPLVENVDGQVDGVACNPTDFWAAVSTRADTSGTFVVNPFADPSSLNLWGLNTVRTRAVPASKAYTGAWRMGAQIFDREAPTIRVGDQHADFFVTNKVAILVEERIALPVYRPDWFVEGTIS